MVITRCQGAVEAKRRANAQSLLHKLPQELLLMTCRFLLRRPSTNLDSVHLRRQPIRCKTRHPGRCGPGDYFNLQNYTTRSPTTTLWQLMQASWYLRNFARPLYMANTIHTICVQQLSAYQQSVFCDQKVGLRCRFITIHLDTQCISLKPFLTAGFYHNGVGLVFPDWDEERRRDFSANLYSLINLHKKTWMESLLHRVKDLSLDTRGDIRLIPDPQQFAAYPDLSDLMNDLAQLRLHLHVGLYILLLPGRETKENKKRGFEFHSNKKWNENLTNDYWKKGAQLGRIQKVSYGRKAGVDFHFDIIPTKEFIATGCDLLEVGVGLESFKRFCYDALWLRLFPPVGFDVEEDGFEWRECGEEEDRDWLPMEMTNWAIPEDESEESDADDVVNWKRAKTRKRDNIADKSTWKTVGKIVVTGGEYENDNDLGL